MKTKGMESDIWSWIVDQACVVMQRQLESSFYSQEQKDS